MLPQAFADRVAGIFVPVVLMLALITWLSWCVCCCCLPEFGVQVACEFQQRCHPGMFSGGSGGRWQHANKSASLAAGVCRGVGFWVVAARAGSWEGERALFWGWRFELEVQGGVGGFGPGGESRCHKHAVWSHTDHLVAVWKVLGLYGTHKRHCQHHQCCTVMAQDTGWLRFVTRAYSLPFPSLFRNRRFVAGSIGAFPASWLPAGHTPFLFALLFGIAVRTALCCLLLACTSLYCSVLYCDLQP